MHVKIGKQKMSVTDDEVLAVALLSVMKWNAASITDVIDHLCHYVRNRDGRRRMPAAKVS